jgi:hypothetical protein
MVRPVELGIAVVDAPLHAGRHARMAGGEVQLAGEATDIARVCQELGNEDLVLGMSCPFWRARVVRG